MNNEELSRVEIWATAGFIVVIVFIVLMSFHYVGSDSAANTEHQIYVRCLETQVLEPDECRVLVYGEEE